MDGFDNNNDSSRRPTDRLQPSPSYFNNVFSLDADSMASIPSCPPFSSEANNDNKNTQHDDLKPLANPANSFNPHGTLQGQDSAPIIANVRSRKGNGGGGATINRKQHNRRRRRKRQTSDQQQHDYSGCSGSGNSSSSRCCPSWCFGSSCGGLFWCCHDRRIVRSTLSCMNVVARILSWCTVFASVAGVVWYSYELKKTG